ncbi:MAG: type II toxin-antitoxin system RelE/ParE family toxin [Bacteroidales bacterium]|nr:type II toxin-antitoxin system RelE/ParE family toxin [Bacteroidales bacterium]MBO7462112.1 type II toxin-antitoxin system RelE/ParE family toxin [Bacteroidales bacterium]
MKVIVSERAEGKLLQTADYIEDAFGLKSRHDFLQAFRQDILRLMSNPYMWTFEPLLADFPSGYRSFVLNHINKVIYRIVDDTIEISDLWDCRRNPDALVAQLVS